MALTTAQDLLREMRVEVGRADSKAATMLAGVLVVVAIIGTSALNGHWSPLTLRAPAALTWWAATAALACGIVQLCACIYPSLRRDEGSSSLSFFGDVRIYTTRKELLAALSGSDRTPLEQRVDQLFDLSRIVHRKYWVIRSAFWTLAASATLAGVSLLVDRLH